VFPQSNLLCCDGEEDRNGDAAELFDPSWDGGYPLTPGCWVGMTRVECHPLRTVELARHPSAVDVGVVGTDDNVVAVVVVDVVAAVVGVDDVTDVVANETDCAGGDRTNLLLLLSQGPVSCCCCCCCC
jgi:hypothetical protein